MICPYCAEEVKDAATVCRYCGRDLAFFKYFEKRISTLEDAVARLGNTICDLSKQHLPETVAVLHGPYYSWIVGVIGTVITGGLSSLATWRMFAHFDDTTWGVVWFASPLIFLLYVAASRTYARYPAIAIMGAAQGAVAFGSSSLLAHLLSTEGHRLSLDLSALFILTPLWAALFVALSWVVRRLQQRFSFNKASASAQFAYALLGRPNVSADAAGASVVGRWKRVSEITAALGPILTLIGSIVAAYFGYLGTLAKAGPK